MAALELGGELSPLPCPRAGPLRRRGPDPLRPGASAGGAPRRRARPGVFTVRVGPGGAAPSRPQHLFAHPGDRRDPPRSRGSRGRGCGPRPRGPPCLCPAAAPPAPGVGRPRSRAAGAGKRAAAPEQTMNEGVMRGGGGGRGGGGAPQRPFIPARPLLPPRPRPLPAPAPRSGHSGRGPALRDPSPNHKTSPNSAN